VLLTNRAKFLQASFFYEQRGYTICNPYLVGYLFKRTCKPPIRSEVIRAEIYGCVMSRDLEHYFEINTAVKRRRPK